MYTHSGASRPRTNALAKGCLDVFGVAWPGFVVRPFFSPVSLFDKLAQAREGIVPLLGNHGEVTLRLPEAAVLQLPKAFAAAAGAADEAGLRHHTKVFGDGLTSDARARSEACDGQRASVAETGDEP
jgi:hypothetical protein